MQNLKDLLGTLIMFTSS